MVLEVGGSNPLTHPSDFAGLAAPGLCEVHDRRRIAPFAAVLLSHPDQTVRRHISVSELHRGAIVPCPNPPRGVECRYRHVGVTELLQYVAELNARSEELRCERVAEILRRPVTDAGPLEDSTPFAVPEVPRFDVLRCQSVPRRWESRWRPGTLASGESIDNIFYRGGGSYTGTITLIPEPSSVLLLALGLVGIAASSTSDQEARVTFIGSGKLKRDPAAS